MMENLFTDVLFVWSGDFFVLTARRAPVKKLIHIGEIMLRGTKTRVNLLTTSLYSGHCEEVYRLWTKRQLKTRVWLGM